jgi:citrate lyase subunit beta/citryl-CoA lyase
MRNIMGLFGFGKKKRQSEEAAEAAAREGLGVVSLNGKMVDGPVIDRARLVLSRAELSGIREE